MFSCILRRICRWRTIFAKLSQNVRPTHFKVNQTFLQNFHFYRIYFKIIFKFVFKIINYYVKCEVHIFQSEPGIFHNIFIFIGIRTEKKNSGALGFGLGSPRWRHLVSRQTGTLISQVSYMKKKKHISPISSCFLHISFIKRTAVMVQYNVSHKKTVLKYFWIYNL